jgi:LacI family transcriptional regulator
MERLLTQAPKLTAVFAASDLLAAGALQTLFAQGIRVPEQMSIVDFFY